MSNATNAELLAAARRIIAANAIVERPKGLPPGYHGPIDLSYVRPAPQEFPKMIYKASKVDPRGYITRVVNSKEEQDKHRGWATTHAEVDALLGPLIKAQYVSPDEAEGDEPEEKAHSLKTKQAAKDAVK